jgi:hypothetical protein
MLHNECWLQDPLTVLFVERHPGKRADGNEKKRQEEKNDCRDRNRVLPEALKE